MGATQSKTSNDTNDTKDTNTVKVASIQAPSIFKNTQANIDSFSILVRKAAANGAKIIVLPEAAITGYASQDFKHAWCIPIKSRQKKFDNSKFTRHDPYTYAEPKNGAIVQHFKKLCKELQIYLTVPYVEIEESDPEQQAEHNNITNRFFEWYKYKYYNSISLINPSGQVIAHYRKTNLWPYYDHPWATPGDQLVTADTEYGKVGLGICFDVHKILPGYKHLGIWSLLYCIAWVDNQEFIWFSKHLPKLLKIEDITYNVIGCNWSVQRYKKNDELQKNKENKEDHQSDDDKKEDVDDDDDDDNAGIDDEKKDNDMNENDKSKEDDNNAEIKYDWYGFGKSTIYGPYGEIIAFTDNLYDEEIIYADIPYSKI